MQNVQHDYLLDMEETAFRLGGIHTKTVYRMLRDGKMNVVRVRRRTMVPASEVTAFLAREARPLLASKGRNNG